MFSHPSPPSQSFVCAVEGERCSLTYSAPSEYPRWRNRRGRRPPTWPAGKGLRLPSRARPRGDIGGDTPHMPSPGFGLSLQHHLSEQTRCLDGLAEALVLCRGKEVIIELKWCCGVARVESNPSGNAAGRCRAGDGGGPCRHDGAAPLRRGVPASCRAHPRGRTVGRLDAVGPPDVAARGRLHGCGGQVGSWRETGPLALE